MIFGTIIYFNTYIDYLWSSKQLKLLKPDEDFNLRPYALSGGMVCLFSILLTLVDSNSKAFSIISVLTLSCILWARYNYFLSLRRYLSANSKLDKMYKVLCLTISVVALYYLFQAFSVGTASIFDLTKPEQSDSMLRNKMIPYKFNLDVIIIFSFNYIYSALGFVYLIVKSYQRGEFYIFFGIAFTLFCVVFSNSYHLLNLSYWFPLSIVADIFELMRINYVQKSLIGNRILEKFNLVEGLEGKVESINLEHAVFKHDLVNKFMSSAMYMERAKKSMKKIDKVTNHDELDGLIEKAINAQKMATDLFRNNAKKKSLPLGTIIHQVSELLLVHIRLAPNVSGTTEIYFPMVDLNNILVNLVKNSKEATLSQVNRWVEIGLIDDGEFYHFSVTDSGLYKNIKNPETVFLPRHSSKSSENTGLGLFSVKTIIDKYQGEIDLTQNRGYTCIKFSLKKT